MKRALLPIAFLAGTIAYAAEPPEPKFLGITLDDKVQIGYGLAIADVDGDKLPDILLADKKQFVWYKNPGPAKATDPAAWQKYVIAENLTPKDNVCIAAQDIDGDGKCEIAVGAEWNPGDTENSGAVFYLIPPADRTQLWTPVTLPHEPTVHRMKWVQGGDGKWALVMVPLHGRGNQKGEGASVKIIRYIPPAALNDPKGEWKTEVINGGADMHMTHNFEPVTAAAAGEKAAGIYVGAKEGMFLLTSDAAGWHASPRIAESAGWPWKDAGSETHAKIKGMGELRRYPRADAQFAFVAVEPMHGTDLVDYTPKTTAQGVTYERHLLTDKLSDGHALACGDLLGWKEAQVVIGWRGNPTSPTPDNVGIKIFTPIDAEHTQWRDSLVDNKIACEDLMLADLNGDGKLDIIGAGRATHNLKVYFNQTGGK